MVTIIRKLAASQSSHDFQVEIIDGEHGIRSIVAEVKDFFICEEHFTSIEIAECIRDAITTKIKQKFDKV